MTSTRAAMTRKEWSGPRFFAWLALRLGVYIISSCTISNVICRTKCTTFYIIVPIISHLYEIGKCF